MLTGGSLAVGGPARWPSLAIAVTAALLLSLLHLPWPFDVDQTYFMAMAQEMDEGGRLYIDFWDVKQPGIFWWFHAAGTLFGFDALGIRRMDIVWTLVTAPVLWAIARPRGHRLAVLAPVLAFAAFYARATPFHLSQIEWLIGLPFATVVWCLLQPTPMLSRQLLIGAMLAVTLVVKTVLVIVPLAMIGVALASSGDRRAAVRRLVPALLVCALGVAAALGWMAHCGSLTQFLWVTFGMPAEMAREYGHNPWALLGYSYRWFAVGTWALLPAAAWAAWQGWRRRRLLEGLLAAWVVGGCAVISTQLMSFWQYHFGLLFIPVGMLAAIGVLDIAARRPKMSPWLRRAAGAWTMCLVASLAWPLAAKARSVAMAWPGDLAHRNAFLARIDARWPVMQGSASVVKPYLRDGDRITAWGDQLPHVVLGHRPVARINGDTFLLARQVAEAAQALRSARPALVYMTNGREAITNHGGDAFPRTLAELYVPVHEDAYGVWYRLR